MDRIIVDATKPGRIFRFSERKWLLRSLMYDEFRLRPASDYADVESDAARCDDERLRVTELINPVITHARTGQRIMPLGPVTRRRELATDYYLVCFSSICDPYLYDEFPGSDACLAITDVAAFSQRLHDAVEQALPDFAGVDAKVSYGVDNPLGVAFSKPDRFVFQHEFRFAWLPYKKPIPKLAPVVVSMGNLEGIAELVERELE